MTADDPVPKAKPAPVLVPSPKELVCFIAGSEHVRRVICTSPLITVDREDRIDIGWQRPPQQKSRGQHHLSTARRISHQDHATSLLRCRIRPATRAGATPRALPTGCEPSRWCSRSSWRCSIEPRKMTVKGALRASLVMPFGPLERDLPRIPIAPIRRTAKSELRQSSRT